MRLFEVEENRYVNDLVVILRNIVGRANSKDSAQPLSYPALSHLLKNIGYGSVDFEQFSHLHDEYPSIQALVKDFNEDGMVLSTKKDKEETPDQMEIPVGPSVDQMASRGAKTHLDNISK
jgi:hypothetical protein